MDCSMQAADNHLRAAELTLRQLTGDEFDALTRLLRESIITIKPDQADTQQFVSLRLGAWAAKRVAKRVRRVLAMAMLIVALILAWIYRDSIRNRLMPESGQQQQPTKQ
jgi:thiol:disulfide interchange protein